MRGHVHLQRNAACILIAVIAPATAMAQSATVELDEVVVTAQHVEEDLQKAAISATVASGDELVERGIVDTAGLERLVPGITIAANNAYTNYNIRGITSGGVNALSDTAIAVNYNQVSLATPSSASGLYYDLERVELVNGPQGTLYGRNATAGAINVVARRPVLGELSGSMGVDTGNYRIFNGRMVVNVPLADTIAMRVAGQTANHDGYYSDGGSDQNDRAVRVGFLAQPTDNLSLYLTGDYATTHSHGLGTSIQVACTTDPSGFCFVEDPRTGLGDLMEYLIRPRPKAYNNSYFWGLTGNVEWTTDVGTLTIVPAFRRHSAHTISNNASFGTLKGFDEPIQKSLEVRFLSNDINQFKYQVGLYGLVVDVTGIGGAETASRNSWSANFYKSKTTSYAPFGQLTYSVTDTVRLVAGARYTTDRKTTDSLRYTLMNTGGPDVVLPNYPPTPGGDVQFQLNLDEGETWHAATYKAGVEWDVTPSSFAYFDVRSGFKAGGFFFAPDDAPEGFNHYDPEHLTAYSFGIKNRFLQNRLQANLEGFLYDYKDQQLSVNLTLNGNSVVTTQNVGHSKIRGSQLTLDWLALDDTRIGFDVRWAKGDYDRLVYVQSTGKATSGTASTSRCEVTQLGTSQFEWDCSGLGFPNLAKWAYTLDLEQGFHLPTGALITATANYRYEGPRETSLLFTDGARADADKYMDANIQYRSPSGNWDLTAFVNNLVRNRSIIRAQTTGASGVIYFAGSGAPRTWGIRTNYRF